MDSRSAAIADLDATLRNLDEARKALEADDFDRFTKALRERQWVFPQSVWRVHREMREARASTLRASPLYVTAAPDAEWVQSVGDFGPPQRRVCAVCGSSWLGQGECPDAELHSVWVASRE